MKFPVSVIAPAFVPAPAEVLRSSPAPNHFLSSRIFPGINRDEGQNVQPESSITAWNHLRKSPDKKELAGGWPHPYAGIRA
jgi:hypothetical protein